jgi:hypothetical protein
MRTNYAVSDDENAYRHLCFNSDKGPISQCFAYL